MEKVTKSIQDLYEKEVLKEFYHSLNEHEKLDMALSDAVVYARGIYDGGAFLGFEYDFNACYTKLYNVYKTNKNWGWTL